jgi:hypothetical protein
VVGNLLVDSLFGNPDSASTPATTEVAGAQSSSFDLTCFIKQNGIASPFPWGMSLSIAPERPVETIIVRADRQRAKSKIDQAWDAMIDAAITIGNTFAPTPPSIVIPAGRLPTAREAYFLNQQRQNAISKQSARFAFGTLSSSLPGIGDGIAIRDAFEKPTLANIAIAGVAIVPYAGDGAAAAIRANIGVNKAALQVPVNAPSLMPNGSPITLTNGPNLNVVGQPGVMWPGSVQPPNAVAAERAAPRMFSTIDNVGSDSGLYRVGAYDEIKGTVPGLDAHHVGQKALMGRMIPDYDPLTAPAILVPKVGHTIRGPRGIVSRSTAGLETPRAVLARDIMELRRVYPDIPNAQLQQLVQSNKTAYPQSFIKGN